MCDFTKGLKFCTCDRAKDTIVHNKKSRRNKDDSDSLPKEYTWTLDRYITTRDTTNLIGSMTMPRSNLGNGLTEEWVLLHLNTENCFDFDYTPDEGDRLMVQDNDDHYNYMSFIFKGICWIADVNIDFGDVMEEKNRGIVKPILPEENEDQ